MHGLSESDHKELLDVKKISYLLEKDQIATGQRESVKRNEFAKNVQTRTGKGPKRSQEVGFLTIQEKFPYP